MSDRNQSRCTVCQRLAGECEEAWRSDQQEIRAHLRETAKATGVAPAVFVQQWIRSLAEMPDDEFDSLQGARYRRVAEVTRRWKEHAALSGHAGLGDGWRRAFILEVVRRGYRGFLNGRWPAAR